MNIKISTCADPDEDLELQRKMIKFFNKLDIPVRILFGYQNPLPIVFDNNAWKESLKKESEKERS